MTEVQGDSGRDRVEVHNRLDKVVLALSRHDADSVQTTLTADGARRIADSLRQAAEAAERTPGS